MCSYQQSFRICGYIKTQHFLERQLEREIPDHVIRLILSRTVIQKRFSWVVVGRELLKSWISRFGAKCPTQCNLIIVADGDKLITCYFGKVLHNEFPKNHQLIIIQHVTTNNS